MEKTSKLLFAFTFAFLVLLSVGFSSANLVVSKNPVILNTTSGFSNSTTFTLSNNDTANWTGVSIVSLSGGLTVLAGYNTTLDSNTSQTITLSASGFSSNTTANLNITYNNGSVQSFILPVSIKVLVANTPTTEVNFCDMGNQGTNLSTDLTVINSGEGEDDDWYYLDDVEIEVEVSNNGNKKINDVIVEIAIFSDNTDVTDDFNFEDTKITLGSINDDDSETATFVLNSVPVDMGEGSYTIKAKAYVKGNEDTNCKQESESTQVTNPFDEGVIVNGGSIDVVTEAVAGGSIEVSFDVTNLGTDKEDEVLVTIYNKDLGIDEKYNLNDLRSGKSETITFPLINIPANIQTKTYTVDVEIYFNYDSGDITDVNSYDYNSYDDLAEDYNTFSFGVKVLGGIDTSVPSITAKLNSVAKVGENLSIEVSIKNVANKAITFTLSPEDYEDWAVVESISSTELAINSQATKTSVITFKPTKTGSQTFSLVVVYDGGKTTSKLIRVDNIAAKDQNFFARAIENYGNTTVWLITAIVALVVLILIILLIRLIIIRN